MCYNKASCRTKPENARIFSLGRVFRNEKVSYKHLVEFNQIEGIVIGNNTTLRDLMGIQKEFYKKLGLTKINFGQHFFHTLNHLYKQWCIMKN